MGFENGQLVRVALEAKATGVAVVNTFHYDLINQAGFGPNDPQSLADFFRDNVISHFATLFTNDFQIQPVVVTDEKDPQAPNKPRGQWSSGTASPGTRVITGDFLPFGCVVISSNRTDHIGRRYRGRTFVGGAFAESDQAGSVWNAGIVDLCNQYMTAVPRQPDISGAGSTSTARLGVYSRTNRSQNVDPYISKIVSTSCSSKVHFLRSRAG